MSTSTYIKLLNTNDPKFIAAANGSPEEKQTWEEDWGSIENNPGAEVETKDDFYEETDEEYGGWVIDLSKLPKEATHIKIERF